MKYSKEQQKYIFNPEKERDTKLIACAGSGKTACIIERIVYLINSGIDYQQILMLTFSRFTRNDFINKSKGLIPEECVKTIDSFANSIINNDCTVDISLLSLTFWEYLKEGHIIDKIKYIFVDEAQDLNEIQAGIINELKKRNKIINLIGDPNQNIYQFRGSNDTYFYNYNADTFYLTINYRSAKHIVDFSKHLRCYNDTNIKTVKKLQDNTIKPTFFCYNKEEDIENEIIRIIKQLKKINIDLADICILAPTRGHLKGNKYTKSRGLSLVSNMLINNNIPFVQFYNENSDEQENLISYKKQKGKINLMTYMGSKGLQWDYVILLDANFGLINKRYFDLERHYHDRYLLYVACSRAIKQMFIFTSHIRKKPYINPWFEMIPKELYTIDEETQPFFGFPELKFTKAIDPEYSITKLINRLTEYKLYDLSKIINYKKMNRLLTVFGIDCSKKETIYSNFLGKLSEFVFRYQYNQIKNEPQKKIKMIENIISKKNMLEIFDYEIIKWFNENKKLHYYEIEKMELTDKIRDFINKLDKTIPLLNYTIIGEKYYKKFIESKIDKIKEWYEGYLSGIDWRHNIKNIFYILLIITSFETYHYYHIYQEGQTYLHLLDDFKDIFNNSWVYLLEYHQTIKELNFFISDNVNAQIDIIETGDIPVEIKCVNNIGIKHIIQLLAYNWLIGNRKNCLLKFINLLTGQIIEIATVNTPEVIIYLESCII